MGVEVKTVVLYGLKFNKDETKELLNKFEGLLESDDFVYDNYNGNYSYYGKVIGEFEEYDKTDEIIVDDYSCVGLQDLEYYDEILLGREVDLKLYIIKYWY